MSEIFTEETIESYQAKEKKLTDKFSHLLFSDEVLIEQKKVFDLIKTKTKNPEQIIKVIRDYIEIKLFAWMELQTISQFAYMDLTNNWTEAGQDRVRLSFIRLLLNIPAHQEVTYSDYLEFEEKIKLLKEKYDIFNKTKSDLEHTINYPEIILLGKIFKYSQTREINTILESLDSQRRVIMGDAAFYKTLMMGIAETRQYGSYYIHLFVKEEMRTPGNVHYIVASIEGKDISIRMDVCRYVFYSKWVPVWEMDIFSRELLRSMEEENISESIKISVLQSFNVDSQEDFIAKENDFLNAMTENLLYHEVAHDAMEDTNLTLEETGFIQGLSCNQETILSVLSEILTEWMPSKSQVKGPLRNMVDLAMLRNEKEKARQMLLIYISDAWFYDTDTQFMYSYSDIMMTILLQFINQNEIDFLKMHQEFEHIFDHLMAFYRQLVTESLLYIKGLSFKDNEGKIHAYQSIFEEHNEKMDALDLKTNFQLDDKEKHIRFWNNYFIILRTKNPESFQNVIQFFKVKETELMIKIARRFMLPEYRNNFEGNIRNYVFKRMIEVGFNLENVQL